MMAPNDERVGVDKFGKAPTAIGRSISLTSKTSSSLLRALRKPLGRSLSTRMRQVSLASIKAMPELCGVCYELVYTPGSWSRGRRFVNRGTYPELGLTIAKISTLQTEACELCRALSDLTGNTQQGNMGWEIRELPLIMISDSKYDTDVPSFMVVVPWNSGVTLRAVEREEERRSLYRSASKRGQLICCPRIEEGKPRLFSPRIVGKRIDPGIIGSWLSACDTHHPLCTASESRDTAPDANFIDCQTRTLISGSDLPPAAEYVALSYVWGVKTPAKAGPETSKRPGSTLPDHIPTVIGDAIKVTLALGFQFLWVDQYCIDQKNQATKHKQIFHMDAIYRHACFTIIAAAGADQSTGLPGVTQDRPARQTSIQTDEVSILSTLPSPVNQIVNSKWASRAWTFQEAILSHRRLVFTEDQLYFECDSMHCYESLSVSFEMLYATHSRHSDEHNNFIKPKLFGFGHHTAGILTYVHCAEEYTRRSLTFDEDSLNAFTGVTRNLEKTRKPPVRNISGIPFLHPSDVATPSCNYLQMLLAGLAWRHQPTTGASPRRRQGFPSWSWAGWAGSVVWPDKNQYAAILNEGTTSGLGAVRLQLEDDSIAKISDMDFRTDEQAVRRPRALFLDAVALPRDALVFDQGSNVLRSQSGGEIRFYPSKEGLTPAKTSKRLHSGRYEALRLVTLGDNLYMLLVKRYRSSYYRIGLMMTKTFWMLLPPGDENTRTFKLK
ncbi:hypothetical protein KVR01_004685 [Diaporthe batatas]|uniref:uncharacterized protein n=1 Tax=Diaporthe batatas TaxID=748121 RepID=UPI001D03B4ED|nr:uncharacterized protein KVR01_004685 [Diaporthe batatas]KAG8166133.1 hypothetical protein KVR01_004685 [Diaporthe batatas]